MSTRRQWLWISLWVVLVAVGGVWLNQALHVDSDLRLFLPDARTGEERILLDELKEGPGARALLVALSGPDPAALPSFSERIANRLRLDSAFSRVENGTLQSEPVLQELLLRYRYLLSPRPMGCACATEALRAELEARLVELGSPAGAVAEDLLLRDPSGELQAILDAWLPAREPRLIDGVWFSSDGQQALLYLQTAAAGFDADQQRLALAALASAVHETDPTGSLQFSATGPGAFTVLLEQAVRKDITLLGTLAGVGSVLFLLLVLRSLRHTLLGLLSLATTSLAAMAGVVWLYPSVHGITLAFGFTLLGVAMDYPVHLMLHLDRQTGPEATLATVWPTLRLSIITTCIAYLALMMTGFTGLTQLGTFTVCGLVATGVVIRWVLPSLVSSGQSRSPPSWLAAVDRLPRIPWLPSIVLLIAVAALVSSPRSLWSNELSGLTPVPQELQDLDTRLRNELGAPDLRYLIAIRGIDQQAVLQRDESLRNDLERLVTDNVIGSFESPSRMLPSIRRQQQTQSQLPAATQLRQQLQAALKELPFREDAFEAFIIDVDASRQLTPLTPEALEATPLGERLNAVLLTKPDEAIALVTLTDVRDPGQLAEWARTAGTDIVVLDLKTIAENLIARYRTLALAALTVALIIIAGVMLVQLRWRATLAILLPVLATLAATVSLLNLSGIPLTLFHVVSLLLVGGLSFDYGLFFNRSEATDHHALRTRYSVMVCWVSTLGAFALLLLSQMPVLKAIGFTVSLGVSLGFALALLARHTYTREITHAH